MAIPRFTAMLGFFAWLSISAIALPDEPAEAPLAQASALKLLELGFVPRIVPLDDLERIYQSELSQLPAGSPCLEYAFALVLSRNLQPKQALVHLQAAANSHSPVLLPAHEELIRQAVAASDYPVALEKLAEYACLVNEIPPETRHAAEATRAASWLGSVVAYLEGPAGAPDDVAALSKLTGDQLKLLLDQRFVKDYEAGRLAVKELQADLQRQLNEAMTQTESKRLDDQQELQTRKEQIEQRATEIKETSSTNLKTMREQLSDVDNKIKSLEKQFGLSLEAEQRLMAAQILLQGEISRLKQLQQQNQNSNNRIPNNGLFNRTAQINEQIALAEAQYALSINQHAILLQSRFELTGNAKTLLQLRQGLAQKAGMTAVQTQSQLDLMNRWEHRLKVQGKKQDKANASESTSVARIRRRMSDLATYDNDSLEHRRQAFINLLQPASTPNGQ